jgi:hypothetical protein
MAQPYATLSLIIDELLIEKLERQRKQWGSSMCDEIHEPSGNPCALGVFHTGLHESDEGDVWSCQNDEHIFFSSEIQAFPFEHCIVCGAEYKHRNLEE